MDRVAEGEPRLHEVHPEVSFKHMAGHGLRYPKRSPQGMAERRELLAGQGIEIPAEAYALRSVAVDDLFDAAAAAWSAQRIATGEAGCLPADAATGEHGRPIAIWY
jgi:predicted RNase H-like nuclease